MTTPGTAGDDRPPPSGEPPDSVLVRRAQAGDRQAFGEIVTRYMQRAYYAALGLVGSHDDALDLSQEAFVRAYNARSTLDPERPFYAWFYQILRRLCFSFLRNRATRERKLAEAAPWLTVDANARAAQLHPQARVEKSELRARLENAMGALTDRQRELIVLREFEGLRYREIAELLDIPMGTVMSGLYAARQHLATSLRDVL